MMTQRSTHMSLPPPPTHSLVDLDREVGWTNGRTIGFTGFADEHEAAGAAWLAHRTIARRLANDGSLPIPVDAQSLSLESRDGREVILTGERPIATLVRPGVGSRAGVDWYAFEIDVPPPADHVRVHALAYLVYRTLRRSGMLWSLWKLPEHREPTPVPVEGAPKEDVPRTNVTTTSPTLPSAPVLVAGVLVTGLLVTFLLVLLGSAVQSLSSVAIIGMVLGIAMLSSLAHRWRRKRLAYFAGAGRGAFSSLSSSSAELAPGARVPGTLEPRVREDEQRLVSRAPARDGGAGRRPYAALAR